jgi:GAF domain-containing protein
VTSDAQRAKAGPELLMDTLAGFARTLAQGYEIADVLHDLTERIKAMLDLTGAGVNLWKGGRITFVTSDNESVASLERVQEQHQQGPCVEAARTGRTLAVGDIGHEIEHWPAYAAHAQTVGIVAIAGIPMRLDGSTIGAVNLYDGSPRTWIEEDLRVAQVLSDIATSYVINASRLDHQRRTAEQLQRALDSRIIIEQAKGIISAHREVSIDEAFKLLRKHANDHHASLHATADAVVKLGLRP